MINCVLSIDEACQMLEAYLIRIGLNKLQHEEIKQAFKKHYALHIIFVNGSECSIPTCEY